MIILLGGLFLIGIALTAYAFLPSHEDRGEKKTDDFSLRLPKEILMPKPAVNSGTNLELEQLKLDHKNLQTELLMANNVVKNLREELTMSSATAASAQNSDQLKKDYLQLKEELFAKNKELEKTLNQEAGLNKELKDTKEKLASLQQQPLPPQQPAVEQVSKADYEALNVKLTEAQAKIASFADLNSKLAEAQAKITASADLNAKLSDAQAKVTEEITKTEVLKKENQDALNKIKMLETQIEQYRKEIAKPAQAADSVPKKEYEELKKKLEEAEEILKIVHGSGE